MEGHTDHLWQQCCKSCVSKAADVPGLCRSGAIGTTGPAPFVPTAHSWLVTTSLVALDTSGWDRSPSGPVHPLPAAWDPLWKPGSPSSWATVSEDTFPRNLLALDVCRGSAGSGSGLEPYTPIHLSLYKIAPVLGLPSSLTPFCSSLCVGGSSSPSSQGIVCRNHQPPL